MDDIISLEEALTRVQDKKLKAIELKAPLLDEEKRVRIEMLKHELMIKHGGSEPDEVEDDGFIDALRGRAAEVWAKDGNSKAPKSFVDHATARCSVEDAKMWFNCNPAGPYHWCYKV